MARVKLTAEAVEESTYVITLAFANKAGAAVTPDSATWTLTDGAGTVINSRSALAMQPMETSYGNRLFTVQAVYSSTEGASLPLKEEYQFMIRGLAVVT